MYLCVDAFVSAHRLKNELYMYLCVVRLFDHVARSVPLIVLRRRYTCI